MYISKKLLAAIAVAAVLILFSRNLIASGTDSDPLISKSYLDERLKELSTEIAELKKQNGSIGAVNEKSAAIFTPLKLNPGTEILFGEGTEFVLRVGEAKIIDSTGNGIPDLSSGANLSDGAAVPLNHYLISPRNDGRGLRAKIEVWLLVKGSYQTR